MNKRHETAGERAAERQREGEVKISPRRGEGEQVRERWGGGCVKPRGCGKLRGVREEVKCRRTGDEETTAALAHEGRCCTPWPEVQRSEREAGWRVDSQRRLTLSGTVGELMIQAGSWEQETA